MKGKNSFVLYKSWRSYFELLEEPELITELVYAIFDLADGKEATVTNNRVRSALKAIEPKMKEDLERFKAKCDKNREAAQKRWKDADGMRSHADAMQTDGDTESDSVSDYDTDSDTDDDTDILAMPCQEIPSVADVMEAAHYRDIDMTAEDAQEFLDYFYRDRKGLIDDEPIRNWRNLLKTWDNHKLVETGSVMEQSCEGYEVYKKLPTDVQDDINHDQEMFEGKLTNHIRFSCCHELGHYMLGHKMNLDPKSDLYNKQEIEANYFAAQLLMPEQILIECRKRGKSITMDFLIDNFVVSAPAADKRLTTLSKIQPEWHRCKEKEYDDIILMRFAEFVDTIAPKPIDYLFSDEDERQQERDTWFYKGYRRGDYYD